VNATPVESNAATLDSALRAAMDILHKIAERRLEEALAADELDDYAGKGEPLHLDDLSHVPDELRAGYILLESGGFLPEEVELRNEVVKLGDLISACHEDGARDELVKKRDATSLRLALLFEKRGAGAAWSEYGGRVIERLDNASDRRDNASDRLADRDDRD
jgi:hypothetical protein